MADWDALAGVYDRQLLLERRAVKAARSTWPTQSRVACCWTREPVCLTALCSRGTADDGQAALVGDDANGRQDIFVYDSVGDAVTRVSVKSSLDEADGESSGPAISADGRYVT
jgi:hypothetical protein